MAATSPLLSPQSMSRLNDAAGREQHEDLLYHSPEDSPEDVGPPVRERPPLPAKAADAGIVVRIPEASCGCAMKPYATIAKQIGDIKFLREIPKPRTLVTICNRRQLSFSRAHACARLRGDCSCAH